MKHPIRTFAANTDGRDFVIGDLHGAYSLLEALLKHLSFDPLKDRLFSVGDLVDRGPQSLRCLELLYEPWFHAVLANHEQMMLEAFHGGYMGQFWVKNGGRWGADALSTWRHRLLPSDEEAVLFDLLEKVGDLPLIMTVEKRDGTRAHIIHAELPPGIEVTDADLASPEMVLKLASVKCQDGGFMLWGRYLYKNFYAADLSNVCKVKRAVAYNFWHHHFNPALSHIISGHTFVQRPFTILGQTNIDTGAFLTGVSGGPRWAALTCLDLNTGSLYQARPSGVTEVEALVVAQADIDELRLNRQT